VLALAVLLFGILFTHGVNSESVVGHLGISAAGTFADSAESAQATTQAPTPSSALATDGRHDSHGSPHPAEHCASGQPQYGTSVTSPCFAVSVRERVTPVRSVVKPGLGGAELRAASSVAMRASVVQQV
jgi:hypothetical protein